MEKYFLDEDIVLVCIKADTFPEGVLAAHQKLHKIIPRIEGRMYYGISRPEENGEIVYKAAAEEMEPGEAAKSGLETFILETGTYISILIAGYLEDISSIGKAFQQLIHLPEIDPEGYCVEMFVNDDDVRCMVRLKS